MGSIKVGDIVKGQVTGVTKYGVFVSLNDDYTGLVHISEISELYINNIEELFKVGDVIKVKVLEIDEDKSQVKLSIKKIKFKTKPKKMDLQERGEGFKLLEENLDKWTKEKLEEMNVK